jgi:hypothetical protein
MPLASSNDLILASLADLRHAIANPSAGSPLAPLTDSHVATLHLIQTLLTGLATPVPASPVPALRVPPLLAPSPSLPTSPASALRVPLSHTPTESAASLPPVGPSLVSALPLKAIPSKIDDRKLLWAKCRKVSDPEKPARPEGYASDDENGSGRFSSADEYIIHDSKTGVRFSSDESSDDGKKGERFSSDESSDDGKKGVRFSSDESSDDGDGEGRSDSGLMSSISNMAID